jgi:fatty-acyl-CoA synthase
MRDPAVWAEEAAGRDAGKTAIRFEGRAISYGDLARQVDQAASLFAAGLGLKPGARIGYLGLNAPEQLLVILAAARAGLMVVALNWRLALPEQAYVLANAGISALVVEDGFGERIAALTAATGDIPVFGFGTGGGARLRLAAAVAAETGGGGIRGDASSPLLIVYTAGTTGRPKGAMLSREAIRVNAVNARHMHDMTADDHILTVLPMFHVGGLNIQTLPGLALGASVTLHARFSPEATLAAIARDRPSLTLQVPTSLQAMIAHPAWAATDLSSLRAVATGSTDVPVDLIEAVHARKVPVIQVYGSTETGPVALYQRIEEAFSSVGSIGRAGLASDIRIADAQGNPVPDGTLGEILVRGGNVASGYWRDAQATAQAFRAGWFHSGDVGLREASGLYRFKDRIRNVIISGGENIYPAELERILRGHPGIAEAAIAGRADARWGKVPVAVVVKKDPALGAEDVLAAFEGELARYKHPRAVVFVEALPRNAMGKVVAEDVARLAASRS